MAALSVTVVLTMYLLAHGQRWVVMLLGAGAIAAVVAINAADGSPTATANADLVVQAVLAVACIAGLIIVHVRNHGIEPPSVLEPDAPE
jgi:amino acid transporter